MLVTHMEWYSISIKSTYRPQTDPDQPSLTITFDDVSSGRFDQCIELIALLIVLIITTPWEEVYDLGGK